MVAARGRLETLDPLSGEQVKIVETGSSGDELVWELPFVEPRDAVVLAPGRSHHLANLGPGAWTMPVARGLPVRLLQAGGLAGDAKPVQVSDGESSQMSIRARWRVGGHGCSSGPESAPARTHGSQELQ